QWFNNHSFALGLLNSEQQQMYTKTRALISPVVTRWTAQYCALSRLLETWKALQVTVIKHDAELVASVGKKKNLVSRAKTVLSVCRDDNWWKEITIIKTHIEPLAIAVNIAQGANTRCDQVVLVLGRLYRDYMKLLNAIIDSIEKRWSKVDQDLFISAFYLNPYINRKLRNESKLPLSVIMGMIRRLYCRVFKAEKPPPELLQELVSYDNWRGMFSAEMWPLEDLRDVLKKPDGSLDPLDAWQVLDKTNPLVKLAIYVFNFIPNSASCERLFSEMGNVKTKKRNRLSVKKTRDCAFLKGELRRRHAEEGTARQRLKRR
ncbi:ribonuclease H-like domain-containing protein, partial [Amanita rubescens]